MKKLPILILLITSVVPTLLSGRPVYRCLMSGSAGLVCSCAASDCVTCSPSEDDGTEDDGCGAGCRDAGCRGAGFRGADDDLVSDEPPSNRTSVPSSTCCRISLFRLDCPCPRGEVEVASPLVVELLPVPSPLDSSRPPMVRVATADVVRPPGDPPLYLLHSSFLI